MTQVALLGYGTIGRIVAEELAAGAVPGAHLACVVTRSEPVSCPVPRRSMEEALERVDVVVECAGQDAVREHGAQILGAGRDLVVTSMGALADVDVRASVLTAEGGRLLCTTGAVGGLDLLTAARGAGPFTHVSVCTTKTSSALGRPWMDENTLDALRRAERSIDVFAGTPAEASRLFPESLNVAAAVALAVQDWDLVRVTLRADPHAALTTHRIEAEGPTGQFEFSIRNRPSAQNPRTSAVVPYAVLRTLSRLVGSGGLF